MRAIVLTCIGVMLSAGGLLSPAVGAAPTDGLVASQEMRLDQVYLKPGADFRAYRKVLLDSAQVDFEKNWLEGVNRRAATLSSRVTEGEASAIRDSVRAKFNSTWAEAFRAAGFTLVDSPGEGVLKLTPRVVDLYVNAPATLARTLEKNYVKQAGRATLLVELRDSRSGVIIGYIRDHRETRASPTFTRVDSGMNEREFGDQFALWAAELTHGLLKLTSRSPLPVK